MLMLGMKDKSERSQYTPRSQ